MRIKASYTVENAVIVPMFMIIIMITLRLCCDMHDELIKASVNSQVVVQTELNDFGKDAEPVQKLILHASQSRVCNPYDALLLLLYLFFLTKCLFLYENRQDLHLVYFILSF